MEDYNVFVLAQVLGYFIEGADSLIYYLFAKKLLGIKEKTNDDQEEENNINSDSDDEMYSLNYNEYCESEEKSS